MCKPEELSPGGYIKTQKRKTKKIISDKIVRFCGFFFVFAGIFPVFGVVTLLPGSNITNLGGLFVRPTQERQTGNIKSQFSY